MPEFAPMLRRVLGGEDLSADEAAFFIGEIVDGSYTPAQAAGLLAALAAKGESADEIAGAARAMRERSLHVDHALPMVVDVVGTGGDHANSINISTMAALVVAAAGIPVAKHGNRAASSACGSADVLEAAGFPIELAPEVAATMLRESNFTFMFAPRYHPAMRNAAAVRRELGVRTVFNLLGPLSNPARATHQVVGVAREDLVDRIGEALRALGIRRVRSSMAVAVSTRYPVMRRRASIRSMKTVRAYGNSIRATRVSHRRCAPPPADRSNAAAMPSLQFLQGAPSEAADVVALNAALVFTVAGTRERLADAFEDARSILRSGAAWHTFEHARKLGAHG